MLSRGSGALSLAVILLLGNVHLVGASWAEVFVTTEGTRWAPLQTSKWPWFGEDVDAESTTSAVGAPGMGAGGAAFVYTKSGSTWTQQQRLDPSDGAPGDRFGTSLMLEGNTLAIGSPNDDNAEGVNAGAVYVFTRSGTTWTQATKIVPAALAADARFGVSVALEGTTLAVGAPGHANKGAVFLFTGSGNAWTLQAVRTPAEAAAGDGFGSAVDLSGDTLVAGSPERDAVAGSSVGSAYVFERAGGAWSEVSALRPVDGAPYDFFGRSVGISGARIVVGSPGHGDGLTSIDNGAAYVYANALGVWVQEAQLLPSGHFCAWPPCQFGDEVGIDGSTVVVGDFQGTVGSGAGIGAVYVFALESGVWRLKAEVFDPGAAWFGMGIALSGSTLLVGGGHETNLMGSSGGSAFFLTLSGSVGQQLLPVDAKPGDRYGWAVAARDGAAAVAAVSYDTLTEASVGAVFVYSTNVYPPDPSGPWFQDAKFVGADTGDSFGSAVDVGTIPGGVSNDIRVVIGAQFANSPGWFDTGLVSVYKWVGTWSLEGSLYASDRAPSDSFGHSVSLSGNRIAVGAHTDDTAVGANAGSVYIFDWNGASWVQTAKINPADAAAGDLFGASVSLDGNTLVVGANGDDAAGAANAGSVYVYTYAGGVWSQQAKLLFPGIAAGDYFGVSVDVDGDRLVAGASSDDNGAATDAGSASFYHRSGGVWSFQGKVNGATAGDLFGNAVAIDGDHAVIGAIQNDGASVTNDGAVYVYKYDGSSWGLHKTIKPSDGASGDGLGTSIAIDGTVVFAGADYDDGLGGADTGSVYAVSV